MGSLGSFSYRKLSPYTPVIPAKAGILVVLHPRHSRESGNPETFQEVEVQGGLALLGPGVAGATPAMSS